MTWYTLKPLKWEKRDGSWCADSIIGVFEITRECYTVNECVLHSYLLVFYPNPKNEFRDTGERYEIVPVEIDQVEKSFDHLKAAKQTAAEWYEEWLQHIFK